MGVCFYSETASLTQRKRVKWKQTFWGKIWSDVKLTKGQAHLCAVPSILCVLCWRLLWAWFRRIPPTPLQQFPPRFYNSPSSMFNSTRYPADSLHWNKFSHVLNKNKKNPPATNNWFYVTLNTTTFWCSNAIGQSFDVYACFIHKIG